MGIRCVPLSLVAFVSLSASLAAAPAATDAEVRKRTALFAEIPLVTTYSNGNPWLGWCSRWVDWPLTVDRSIPYIEGRQYRVTWPDLRRTLEEMRLGGLDGATFNVSRRNLSELIVDAIRRGERLPALTVPDYPPRPRKDGCAIPPEAEDEPWFAPAFYNSNGYFIKGKPLVTSYWTFCVDKADAARRIRYMRETYGDYWFVGDIGMPSPSKWRKKEREGTLGETDFEQAREWFRTALRSYDGIRLSGYHGCSDVLDGECSFDAAFYRRYPMRFVREVMAEPEFKGKLLGMCVGMGHDNTYIGDQRSSSNGTRTLRDSLRCAYELNPDFITFFEWDEWNENTGIRPTLWNSFAPRRIVRAMRAEHEGRVNDVLPGDDTNVPNLIVSFRKTLLLGDCLRVEVLSVPDAAAKGTATVGLRLIGEDGETLESFSPQTVDLTRMEEVRFRWDTAKAGDSCFLIPELTVEWNGQRRTWSQGLPHVEMRPTANWDTKWALMPLRDLIDGAACAVREVGERDGTRLMKVAVKSPVAVDRLEITDGGDVVYSLSGTDDRNGFREDESNYVFRAMHFCSVYTQKGATMSIRGVSDAEWLQGMRRSRGLKLKLFPQAEYTADTYVRLPKSVAANAVLHIDWPDIGTYEIPLDKVIENGVYSLSGRDGFCFGVHRFNRQAAFFDPVGTNEAAGVTAMRPDLPVSVVSGHAITSGGKICRAMPIVVGARSGRKVPIRVWSEMRQAPVTVDVDSARVPNLRYDISGLRTGTVARGGFGRALDGILGGSTAVATERNRGGDSRQHCCTESYRGKPSRAPKVEGEGADAAMAFDGSGTYFVMPGGTIPTTAAYRLSFDFWPEDPDRQQEIFSAGKSRLWGVIQVGIVEGGLLQGLCLSSHEYEDAYVTTRSAVRAKEWNRLEIVSDVDTVELILNGEPSGKVRIRQPGRFNGNCWFGGRPDRLFKGKIRNIAISHGR